MEFWVQTTLEGYIIEFSAENYQLFSKVEEVFYEGDQGRLSRETPLWMKILMVEEGMLPILMVEMDK
jgi:hypothetical protein